jgi:hypothetical protein
VDFLIADELLSDEISAKAKRWKVNKKSYTYRVFNAVVSLLSMRRVSKERRNISTSNVHSWNAPEKSAYTGVRDVVQPGRGQWRAQFPDMSEIEPRLWSEANSRMDSMSGMGRICIMGFDASQSHSIVEHLERDAIASNAFSASINDILEIATTHETVSMLVVNGDAFGELPDTVDALRNLREIQPHMSIVLVSSKVANDDLSDERKVICDATLRAPVTMARLDVTIRATLVDKIEHCSKTSRDVAYSGCVIPMFQS